MIFRTLVTVLAIFSAPSFAEVHVETDHNTPIVVVRILAHGGVAQDGQNLGVGCFMLDLMQKGTKSMTREQIDIATDDLGASLSSSCGDEVYEIGGAVLKRQLPQYLKLLAEVVAAPSFPDSEIKKTKTQMISSLKNARSDDSYLRSLWSANLYYGNHPYGLPSSGIPATIKNFDAKTLRAQHQKIFNRNNLILFAAGDISEADLAPWFQALNQQLPAGTRFGIPDEPKRPSGIQVAIVDKPDRTQNQVTIAHTGLRPEDPNYYAQEIISQVLGGGFNSRLTKEIRVERGWSYSVGCNNSYQSYPGRFTISLAPANKDLAPAVAHIVQMLKDLKEKGVTAEEFELAKTSLANSSGFSYNTFVKRFSNQISDYVDHTPNYARDYESKINRVSTGDVQRALNSWLHPDQLMITIVGTASKIKGDLAKALGISESAIRVIPYTQEIVLAHH